MTEGERPEKLSIQHFGGGVVELVRGRIGKGKTDVQWTVDLTEDEGMLPGYEPLWVWRARSRRTVAEHNIGNYPKRHK